jgi:superfamily II DNA or RNA helicase
MVILKYLNKKIIIESLDLNQRSFQKLILALNQFGEFERFSNDNIIEISISIDDKKFMIILKRLVSFFESNEIKFEASSELNNMIEIRKKIENNLENSVKMALDFKKHLNDFKESKEWIAFNGKLSHGLPIEFLEFQKESIYLMTLNKGGFNFSVPGSGKTVISYGYFNIVKNDEKVARVLIIGPKSATFAWYDEYKTVFGEYPEYTDLSQYGTSDVINYLSSSKENHTVITFINYERARSVENQIKAYISSEKTLVIFDEAHRMKNPFSKTALFCYSISQYSNFKIFLTGTPMPNGFEDLISMFDVYSPHKKIIGYSYDRLKKMSKERVTRKTSLEVIKKSIYPYFSRISKIQLIKAGKIPKPEFHYHYVEMKDDQRQLYNFLDLKQILGLSNLDEFLVKALKKAAFIRKIQLASNPGLLALALNKTLSEFIGGDDSEDTEYTDNYNLLEDADKIVMKNFNKSEAAEKIKKFYKGILPNEKYNKLLEVVNELNLKNNKIIIWEIFVFNMEVIKELLENKLNLKCEIINGSTKNDERKRILNNFKNSSLNIIIANPATLSESVSLHKACQNSIYISRNFNAGQFIQSKDRIHRINMPEGTTAHYHFILNNESIDVKIDERLKLKEERMMLVLDSEEISEGGNELEEKSFLNDEDLDIYD